MNFNKELEFRIARRITKDDGRTILYKYKHTQFVQKYFTQEEIAYLKSMNEDSLLSAMETIVARADTETLKKEKAAMREAAKPTKSAIRYHYRYKEDFFNNVYELAFWIYSEAEGKTPKWNEDHTGIIVDGVIHKTYDDTYRKWVYHNKGKNYFKQFKLKQYKDFKRKILEYTGPEDAYEYRNHNLRFHYICKECGVDVFPTYHIATHFNDMLCKHCRKKLARSKQQEAAKNEN